MNLRVEWDELVQFMTRADLTERVIAICVAGACIEATDSIIKDTFLPFVELLLPKAIQERHFWVLRAGDSDGPYATSEEAKADGALVVSVGKAVRACLVFLLQGLVVYLVIRLLSKSKHLPGALGKAGARLNDALPTSRA